MNDSLARSSLELQRCVTAASLALVIFTDACSGRDSSPRSDAGTDAGPTCGPIAAPGTAECPPACTGGCDDDHVCTIDCSGPGTCSGDTIDCPADYACLVRCVGLDSCDSGRINCPAAYPCTVVCDGVDGCGDQMLFPDDNPCRDRSGADQVAGCIGDESNFEILVDIASLNDGHDVGLELSEASSELKLIPPGGGPSIHLFDGL